MVAEQVGDILLAVDEACANAVEHGHRDRGGLVSVTARVEDDELHLVVADRGRWKPRGADADPARGRGPTIIHALVPDVVVTTGDAGTVVEMRSPIRRGRSRTSARCDRGSVR